MTPTRWKRLKEITADAFELQPEERAAFLDRVCRDDLPLRREVERLVGEHEQPSRLPKVLELVSTLAAPAMSETAALVTKTEGQTPTADADLAPDLLRRARDRLQVVALLYAIFFLGVHILNELLVHGTGDTPYRLFDHGPSLAIVMVAVLLAGTLSVLIRRGRIAARWVIHVGLLFEIAAGFCIALGNYVGGIPNGPNVLGPLWLCIWIVAFPFVIPSAPKKAAAAAFITAAMAPLAMLISMAAGAMPRPSVLELLPRFAPLLVCAVLASTLGPIVYRMGTELRRAQQLGSYRLESLLGRGGMGEVWVARHNMLARPAALKLIRPEVLRDGGAMGGAVHRFEQEAQNTAALTSPHTVELYDYGTTAEGVFYYAMELLDGLDLESLVRRFGPIPPERALHFLDQICQSLAEAHDRGLVHRDIKPANIFACRQQGVEHDFVKVLDFGLVQRHDGGVATTDGDAREPLAGTPAYMAPESASGGEVGPRSDLYAVGCVAYYLLTGRTVFNEHTFGGVMKAHRQGTPVPPSARTTQPIPAAFDEIVLACLAKKPSDRPAAAAELRARLQAVVGVRPWAPDQARAWWSALGSLTSIRYASRSGSLSAASGSSG